MLVKSSNGKYKGKYVNLNVALRSFEVSSDRFFSSLTLLNCFQWYFRNYSGEYNICAIMCQISTKYEQNTNYNNGLFDELAPFRLPQ